MADSSPLAHSPTLAATDPGAGSSRADERLAAGAKVGEYVVERFIGAGAMGEVYSGRHPVIGKRVAIKILRPELAASTEGAERFIREARAANQIDHDNVVDVFAFGRLDDGRLYLVMDLVEGKSLRAHLVDGALDLATALDIVEPIADALDAAHARGVVHRDLKPDNIVLADPPAGATQQRPKVMVLDFGIAKLISTASDGKPTGPGTLTGAGTWLGTPGYMAPEQWSVDGAGPASDRYALGVIAFELLSGALPYSATSVPAMMEQHFRAEIPSLSSRGAIGLPTSLDAVIRRALAKDPDERFATARAFVAALRDAAGTGALRARGAVQPPVAGPRRLWIPATAGAAVLGVGIVAVVTLRGHTDTPAAGTSASESSTHPSRPAGTVAVEVETKPAGAEVRTSGGGLDVSPTTFYVRPGEALELTIRKPGYLPEHRRVTAGPNGTAVPIDLVAVDEFRGVWQLDSGELRAFERQGDLVNVFKLQSVSGERELFKRYRFELAEAGVAFGTEEDVVDPRSPNEPTCHVRMRVDYYFDPTARTLEYKREKVDLDFRDGKCIERSRSVETARLTRADGRPTDAHEMAPPVGKVKLSKSSEPPAKPKSPVRKTAALDPKVTKQAPTSKDAGFGLDEPGSYTKSSKSASNAAPSKRTPAPSSQIVPQPSAPAPDVTANQAAEPPPAQQQAPQQPLKQKK